MWGETDTGCSFELFFKSKSIDYTGEEVKLAQNLVWEAVQASLPKSGPGFVRTDCQEGLRGLAYFPIVSHSGCPVANGLFAVGKGEYVSGLETQRLIMNLVPVNSICKSLQGDVGTLPSVSGLSGFLLDLGEVALLSSEDIKCFFYLFAIPENWKRYL